MRNYVAVAAAVFGFQAIVQLLCIALGSDKVSWRTVDAASMLILSVVGICLLCMTP